MLSFSFEEFTFERENQLIAVFFLEDFYICEVTAVHSAQEGTVNFMEKVCLEVQGKPVFRWPLRRDECVINADTVFAKDVALAPSSSSGRAFLVAAPEQLPQRFKAFKAKVLDGLL